MLQVFADIKKLDLSKSEITDKGLAHLKKLRSLEELEIDGTGVSEAGYQELTQSLPDCRIKR